MITSIWIIECLPLPTPESIYFNDISVRKSNSSSNFKFLNVFLNSTVLSCSSFKFLTFYRDCKYVRAIMAYLYDAVTECHEGAVCNGHIL